MSLALRLVLVAAMVGGALLFLSSLSSDPVEEQTEETASAEPLAEFVPTGPPAQKGVLDSDENCKECHEEIWNEWQNAFGCCSRGAWLWIHHWTS